MKTITTLSIGALALLAVGCAPKEAETPAPPAAEPAAVESAPAPAVAYARLTPREGLEISGSVSFTEHEGGVAIAVHIEGAPPGPHGLHVHEVGDCSAPDFTSAGGHFNPAGVPHGGPDDAERHAGDLGNVEVGEGGMVHLELDSELLTVSAGPSSVVGLAVILHEKADDLVSQPTGAAGGRLACGVVELAS